MTKSSFIARQAVTVHLTDSLLLLQERLQALQEERKKVIEEADSTQPKAKPSGAAEVPLEFNGMGTSAYHGCSNDPTFKSLIGPADR